MAVCEGTPIPGAAKYAGTVHPLVVVWYDDDPAGVRALDDSAAINGMWEEDGWAGPVQVVVCRSDKDVKVGSCGTYTRKSDGARGQIIRYKTATAVRVIAARTGKTLKSKTFYGSTPACASTLSIPASGSPPWAMYGGNASNAVNEYAMSFLGAGLFDVDRLGPSFDVAGEPVGTSAATLKELTQTVIDGAEGQLVEKAVLTNGCSAESVGRIVRSSTGGDPAIVVVDIAIPCMDNSKAAWPWRAGFRVEMTLANDDGDWAVTKATAQMYCPRGYNDVNGTCEAPSSD